MCPPKASLLKSEEEVKKKYLEILQDLTYSSKPLIHVLTKVAAKNGKFATCIVDCIEKQLERVCGPLKLPILYLIDSIIKCKTTKQYYLPLFSRNIHKLFAKVYKLGLGDNNVRSKLAKLRFTWKGVFPADTLAALDNLVRSVNPSWRTVLPPAVHVTPKFISTGFSAGNVAKSSSLLRQKQRELLELTQRKQELLKVLKPFNKLVDDSTLQPAKSQAQFAPSSATIPSTRPNVAIRSWNKCRKVQTSRTLKENKTYKSKNASRKVVVSQESTSTPADNLPCAKKRKVERSPAPIHWQFTQDTHLRSSVVPASVLPPPSISPYMGLTMGFGFPQPPRFGIITPPNTILEVPLANEVMVEEPTVALNSSSIETVETVGKGKYGDSNPGDLSLHDLVKKLLENGLLPDNSSPSRKDDSPSSSKPITKTETETNIFKPVDLTVTETLRQKQPGMISKLYSGNQCGSCGLRFPKEQTLKYSEHLDWHFRQNRRKRDGARAIHSRKWYYNADDWLKFQEMEDESDRGQSWFDNHPANGYNEESIEQVACVAATKGEHDICELCLDSFEQFFDNEAEEWQLRNAIRIEDKVYHPKCYEGHSDQIDQSDDVEEIIDPTPNVPAIATDDSKKLESIEGDKPMIEGEDSDDEVQLIEEPIEEIIIPDDSSDDEESNLETLLVKDIVLSPSLELENTTVQKIVDITQPISTISIDGNIESGAAIQRLITAPTKIKITMAKSNASGRA